MRQAIQTHFIGPTNLKGSRVAARADAGRITINWNHAVGIEANHIAAAKALTKKLGWEDRWYGGSSFGSGYVFVASMTGIPDFV